MAICHYADNSDLDKKETTAGHQASVTTFVWAVLLWLLHVNDLCAKNQSTEYLQIRPRRKIMFCEEKISSVKQLSPMTGL